MIIRIRRNIILLNLLILSILAIFWIQRDRLLDSYRVEEDFRTFYWMNKFVESDLFPEDHLKTANSYVDLKVLGKKVPFSIQSPGYGILFFAASLFAKPVLFSKILPLILTPLTIFYLFKYAGNLRGVWAGLAVAVTFLLLSTVSMGSQSVMLGVQRSFGPSLMIFLIYYLHGKKYLAASFIVLLCASIYAPAFLLAVVTWGLIIISTIFRPRMRISVDLRSALYLFTASLISLLMLSPFVVSKLDDAGIIHDSSSIQSGQADEQQELVRPLWENPEYQPGGYRNLYEHFPFVGRMGVVDKILDAIHFLILFCCGCLIYLFLGKRSLELPAEIWAILIAGFLLYFIAITAILITNSFPLYMPSRYTRLGIFVFLLFFMGINLPDFARKAPSMIFDTPKWLASLVAGFELLIIYMIIRPPQERTSVGGLDSKWLLVPIATVLGVLGIIYYRRRTVSALGFSNDGMRKLTRTAIMGAFICTILGWGYYVRLIRDIEFLNPAENERELLRFLETLPKDVLIAGYPCALDNVPLFSQRQILFSCEQSTNNGQLIIDSLDSYYADRIAELINYCDSYRIDYLVVDKRTYSKEYLNRGWIYYEPYNSEIYPKIIAQNRFALMEIPSVMRRFENEDYFVVSCKSLE
jgi:hypothetical protein